MGREKTGVYRNFGCPWKDIRCNPPSVVHMSRNPRSKNGSEVRSMGTVAGSASDREKNGEAKRRNHHHPTAGANGGEMGVP